MTPEPAEVEYVFDLFCFRGTYFNTTEFPLRGVDVREALIRSRFVASGGDLDDFIEWLRYVRRPDLIEIAEAAAVNAVILDGKVDL